MRRVVLLKAKRVKVTHLCAGRILIILSVPQHAALPVAKQPPPPTHTQKVWGSAASDLFWSTHTWMCVCCVLVISIVGCGSDVLRVKGPLRWDFVFLYQHSASVINNYCLTFVQAMYWRRFYVIDSHFITYRFSSSRNLQLHSSSNLFLHYKYYKQ